MQDICDGFVYSAKRHIALEASNDETRGTISVQTFSRTSPRTKIFRETETSYWRLLNFVGIPQSRVVSRRYILVFATVHVLISSLNEFTTRLAQS